MIGYLLWRAPKAGTVSNIKPRIQFSWLKAERIYFEVKDDTVYVAIILYVHYQEHGPQILANTCNA